MLGHPLHGVLLAVLQLKPPVRLRLPPDFGLQNLNSAFSVFIERVYGHAPVTPVSAALDLQMSELL